MSKKIKLNIKNTQIAEALKLEKIKLSSLGKKKEKKKEEKKTTTTKKARILPPEIIKEKKVTKKVVEKKKPVVKKEKPEKKKELIEKKEIPLKPIVVEKEEVKKPEKIKKVKKPEKIEAFDSRHRMGICIPEEQRWRKKKIYHKKLKEKIEIIRPSKLNIKLPISIKDLASSMKLKASELISKLFSQGITITLNDYLDDETIVQFLGSEFGCDISIDRTEEKKLQITDKTVKEEIDSFEKKELIPRPPIITFMGHVDHGKTSIIDRIRKSNVVSQEAGAITQHIGAFIAKTKLGGDITILDTPGHEAFTEMRKRGAMVTDIVVLVIAGDEGIREQTIESINQAKKEKLPIIVAINKSDKQGYDSEKVYGQLADYELVPEKWGGTTITVNCSALKNEGIEELLEMIALQSEILELKANPLVRARGVILESQMHKGLGAVATLLIQNGTLKLLDAFVFGNHWGRVKTIHDQNGKMLKEAAPGIPVKVTGLSSLAEAGCEFIVVENEKKAKDISKERAQKNWEKKINLPKKIDLEKMIEKKEKKNLALIIRADMQGSLEALIEAIKKISSKKVDVNIISAEIGQISESDIELAAASNAPIIGFHTDMESYVDEIIKKLKVKVFIYDVIYHAIDAVKNLMLEKLDKIEIEKETGKVLVKEIFSSSQLGKIAGCIVTQGIVKRGQNAKLFRGDKIIWKGKISSLKREKEDVKEVQKDKECGIILENFSDINKKDELIVYDIEYITQEL